MAKSHTLEVPIQGMDCAECTHHVQHALAQLSGVASVHVLLSSEKAVLHLDPDKVDMPAIRKAVASAGNYSVPDTAPAPSVPPTGALTRRLGVVLTGVFVVVLAIVVVGEWLGAFQRLEALVPFPLGVAIVMAGGWPIFRNVIQATLKRHILAHTLMTLGVMAALAVGEWVTAAIVVVFMRVGEYVEHFTTESARRAVKD